MRQVTFKIVPTKQSTWPVFYQEQGQGTVYLPASQMESAIKKHGYSGQAWSFRSIWKTYRPGQGLVYKSLEGLSPDGEQDFWHIMESNYRAGLPPPTSFAAIFHRLCFLPWPQKSVLALFRPFISGAWSQALTKGVHREKMYHYDLNSAYRWSGCQGLPDLKSARRIFSLDAQQALFLVRFDDTHRPPWRTDNIGLISSEELAVLNIKPTLLFGVQFQKWLDLSSVFAQVDARFPYCYKRISRAYWGRWNGASEVYQHGWKHGHRVRALPNPLHNPIWSHYITSRVKLRLYEAQRDVGAVHVQVDAVLCRDPLPTSQEVGGWRLVQEYPHGIWIHNTGQWGHGKFVIKRMGMQAREAEQWVRQLI